MNDFLLKSSMKVADVRDAGMRKVSTGVDALGNRYRTSRENGDIVQTVIIIAMFVLICIIVGKLLTDAIQGQGEKVADCIENVNNGSCANFKSKP